MRPTHEIAGANLRRPPANGIGGEHSGPEKRPLQSRCLNQRLDSFGQRSCRIRLLKEGVWCFDRSRKEYDPPRVPCDSLQDRSNRGRRGSPHQEDRVDAVEALIETLRSGEIAAHYLNSRGKTCSVWVTHQRTDLRVPGLQLSDNFAADPAGGADDKDAIHW